MSDMREIGPTYYFAPPRVLEALLTQVSIRMEDAGAFKRWLYRYFMGVAQAGRRRILDGKAGEHRTASSLPPGRPAASTGRCATCSA